MKRVAMEYSPGNNNPYIYRVDAGTVEAVRELGVEVVSSGDLVQRFEAIWSDEALGTHKAASERLYRIKDRAFALVREKLAAGVGLTEYEVQQRMLGWFADEGLKIEGAPCVAAQQNAGDPHYQATAQRHRAVNPNEILLLDLWGKLPTPGAVFADITWVGYTGAARDGRDAGIELVRSGAREGRDIRGFMVDRATRDVIEKAGYGAQFIHRTGHSLGEEVHGNGVHMDDYETHDERRLIPGTGFTIEPGIYNDEFGVRTEINMFVSQRDAEVTGPLQREIVPLG
jgi:Xaa-Pro aminopeptidase